VYKYSDMLISWDNHLKYFHGHGSERTCSNCCCFFFNKEPVALNFLISSYAVDLASPHTSINLLCCAERIYSQSCTVVTFTLSSVSSASVHKVSVTYSGLTRLELGQQNSAKIPIIKFHKNVSTWSMVVPCRWAEWQTWDS
jgi:hypothetical protein